MKMYCICNSVNVSCAYECEKSFFNKVQSAKSAMLLVGNADFFFSLKSSFYKQEKLLKQLQSCVRKNAKYVLTFIFRLSRLYEQDIAGRSNYGRAFLLDYCLLSSLFNSIGCSGPFLASSSLMSFQIRRESKKALLRLLSKMK
jgi:hypothetical protein